MFRQLLESRRAKKWKELKELFRREKYDGIDQERGNRGANEMKKLLDARSDTLKKTQGDILRLSVASRVLTDNKELDSEYKEIDFSSENNNLLKSVGFDNLLIIG